MTRVFRHITAYITPHARGGMHFFRKVVVLKTMYNFDHLGVVRFRI